MMTLSALKDYLHAATADKATQVVVGHTAPDTDAVISSLFEAWRRRLTAGVQAVPVVQAATLPNETAWLLGEAAESLLTTSQPTGKALMDSDTPLVLTDHHSGDYAPGRVIAIVDHHLPMEGTAFPEIDADIRPIGAATSLVALRCQAEGLTPDKDIARILLGAILLDTENLSPAKARLEDRRAAAWLTALTDTQPAALFHALREKLLSETDFVTLYRRDQRFFPHFSFAILKVWAQTPVDTASLHTLLEADAVCHGTALAKITRYTPDGLHNEYYMAAGKEADSILAVIASATAGEPAAEGVAVPANGNHLSRKRLMPLLLPLLSK